MTVHKQLLEAINDVLFDRWDPIGVRSIDAAWPRDEYADYAGHLVTLVKDGASDAAIAGHLGFLETQRMGVAPTSDEHRLAVARFIRRVVEEFDHSP